MGKRANTTARNDRAAHGARKSAVRTFFVRFMAVFMTIAMVLSGDGVTYATKALAQTVMDQAGEVANAVSDATDRIVTSSGEKGSTSRKGDIADPAFLRTVYFQPNKAWEEGDSRFAAVVTTEEWESWVEGTDVEEDGRFEFQIPSDITEFRFVCLDTKQKKNEWEYVLDQTEKLALPSDEQLDLFTLDEDEQLDLITLDEGEQDKVQDEEQGEEQDEEQGKKGTWSIAAETPLPSEKEDEAAPAAEEVVPTAEETTTKVAPEGEKTTITPGKDEPAEDNAEPSASLAEKLSLIPATPLPAEGVGNAAKKINEGTGLLRSEGDTEIKTGSAKLQGEVIFTDGDFKDLLRPLTFNQTLVVVPVYKDSNDEEKEAPAWTTQNLSPNDQCFVLLYPEGDGTAEFEIRNVPRSVTVDGTPYNVAKYKVRIPDANPSCYKQDTQKYLATSEDMSDKPSGDVIGIGLIVELSLFGKQSTTMDFYSQVIPDDEQYAEFTWKVTFTRPDDMIIDAKENSITLTEYTSTNPQAYGRASLETPAGLIYSAEQIEREGYRLGEGDTRVDWQGTVPASDPDDPLDFEELEVSSENYPINMSWPFYVIWIDNNSIARPKSAEDIEQIFKIQVKKQADDDDDEDSWAYFPTDTGDLQDIYGIDSPPQLTVNGNTYTFTGLPGADMESNELVYRVVCTAPANYTADKEYIVEKRDTITLSHSHSFTATVEWKDDSDKDHLRPQSPTAEPPNPSTLTNLHLYSRTIDGTSTTLTDITGNRSTWQWEVSGDTWTLTVPGLPTYTDGNEEIEYFLVHGTDALSGGTETVTQATITNQGGSVYTPYYNNGTGGYASDEERCHANGTITMLLSSNTTFRADVQWKDDGQTETITARPAATLTLWRYANDETLDEAFKQEHASQVVYLVEGNEHPLSFSLPEGSKAASLVEGENGHLVFTYTMADGGSHSQTISIQLPGHDGAGKKYTYFVRETLTGDNKNNYSTTYTHTHNSETGGETTTVTDTYAEGAPNSGKITNTRREKAMVTVDKTWRNPEGLEAIDGASVRLELTAKRQGDENAQAQKLQVYNAAEDSYEVLTGDDLIAAQTAQGFTATIPTAQQSFYVNIFDDEGLPYDMQNATLVETVTLKNSQNSIEQSGNTITLGADSYIVSTEYVAERSDTTAEPKRYHYDQYNTISSKRQYEVEKNWSLNKPESVPYQKNITAVVAQLQRCKLKDLNTANPGWETVENYVLLRGNASWKTTLTNLDKYDANGNVYYYSADEIGFLVTDTTDANKLPSGATVASITVGDQTYNNYVPFEPYASALGWGRSYSRTDDKTVVANYDEPGSGYFSISKNWKDNNDKDRPESVTIRIYSRKTLYSSVQNKTATGDVDWDQLQGLITPVASPSEGQNAGTPLSSDIVLSKSQGYSVNQTYRSLCNNDEDIARTKHITDYVVLEYKVGDNSQPAIYTYGQIAALSAPDGDPTSASTAYGTARYTGADATKNRDYNVTVSRNIPRETYYILNERTGTTTLTLTKTWNDENNRDNLRPNTVSFQLYRDGKLCTDLQGVQFSITQGEGESQTSENVAASAEKNTNHEYTGTFSATYNESAGGTGNTAKTWTITVSNLPMFDGDTGMLYAYNIDEKNTIGNTSAEGDVHYVQSRGLMSTDQSTGSTQKFNIPLTNTVVGIKTHTAYKYWKDASVTDKNMRPELILTLYRYIETKYSEISAEDTTLSENPTFDDLNALSDLQKKAIDFKKVAKHNDPVMTAGNGTATGAGGQPYDWKIDIDDLQRFDAEGREYVYVLREQLSNEGVTVLGTYKGTTVRTGECDEFTNTITADLTLSGTKTWKGHTKYTLTMNDLPEPRVTLYRTTDSELSALSDLNQKTDEQINYLKTAGRILELDTIEMKGENRSSYAFPSAEKIAEAQGGHVLEGMELVDGTLMLPKYDQNGQRYTYLMRETLLNTDVETLYAKTSASGTLVNTLNENINRREITVHKKWDKRPGDANLGEYHSVTFHLYRYVQNPDANDGGINSAQNIRNITIKANEFKNDTNEDIVIVDTDTEKLTIHHDDGSADYTFKDLLVKSPTAQDYGYYVTEESIDGYDTIISKDPNFTQGEQTVSLADAKDLAFTNTEGWNTSTPIKDNIYVQNSYDPSAHQLNLKGGKVWNDWHDEAGIRPASITIKLSRITDEETGQDNSITSHELTLKDWDGTNPAPSEPWIMWVKTGQTDSWGRDKWTYEIGGLPRYAPNGMPYIYTVSEQRTEGDGYQDPGSVSTSGKTPDQQNKVDLNDLTNSLSASYRFRKYWQDGSNIYNLRPESITVVLQYSTDNGASWQDLSYKEAFELKDSNNNNERVGVSARWVSYSGTTYTNHNGALAVVLTAAKDAVPNTANNTWDYTFSNLPPKRNLGTTENPDVKSVIYRCVEVKIGNAEVNDGGLGSTNNEGLKEREDLTVGAYKLKYRNVTEKVTEVENTLDSSNLKVTKVWRGDQDDLYGSRPDSVTFKLQRRGYAVTDTNNTLHGWTDVVKGNGDTYTFTVTKADNWERTLENLPVSGTDEVGTQFYSMEYRAVELHEPENSNRVLGALNYEDQTNYDDEDNDGHTFDPVASDAKNTSTITNKLIAMGGWCQADKVWYASDDANDDTVVAEFELQYQIYDQEEEWHSFSPSQVKTVTKKSRSETQTVKWTDLPRYDREGNPLYYQIVEHPVNGYKSTLDDGISSGVSHIEVTIDDDTDEEYIEEMFMDSDVANIELQDYTVTKTWKKPGKDPNNVAYIPSASNGSFTSTFKLQQKIGNGDWTDCTPPTSSEDGTQTLTGNNNYTWHDLPKYTAAGQEITYRAVETHINGSGVANNTDGNYIVTYDYDGADTANSNTQDKTTPAFDDTQTDSANRLVYGFVDLSKEAAYLAPGVTDLNADLSGVEFKIQKNGQDYATGILTDSDGRLTRNSDGTYGTQHRYLIPGTYTLLEVDTHNVDYARWANGVNFTVGLTGGNTDTGEHGTAWIYTDTTTTPGSLTLAVAYLHPTEGSNHSFGDNCKPSDNPSDAYNLESRGVITFTKKGNGAALDTHSGSNGEVPAYFGVYTNSACTNQVAGMVAADGVSFALTNTAQDGSALTAVEKTAGVPYLRSYNINNTTGFTLLSGTYYVKELVPPAGYIQDTTVRTVTIARLNTTAMSIDLSEVYANNKGTFAEGNTADYQWPNTPNKVTIYKLDQFGRKVRLKDSGYLALTFNSGNFPTGENTIRLYQNDSLPATKADGTTQVGSGNDAGSWSITYNATAESWTITGLFDAEKSYTLSEAEGAAPDENITAKPITFTIGADGKMHVGSGDTHTTKKESGNITTANGAHDDYNNYYQPSANNNQIVLRDVARFRKNVALKKVVAGANPETTIQYISFNLYHVKHNADGTDTEELVTDPPLTTGADGVIDLSKLDGGLNNKVTGSPLKNGLDLGDYFFREVEKGASDGYRLANDIHFSIVRVPNPTNLPEDMDPEEYYAAFAEVQFKLRSTNPASPTVSQLGDQGTVENTPVQGKTLELTKQDADGATPLSGARFELKYVSITNGDEGSKTSDSTPITTYAMTDANGVLKTATVSGDTWTIGTDAPNISAKGTYTLTELQAPSKTSTQSGYSTYTNSGTTTTPAMLKFFVDSDNEITHVSGASSYILSAFTGTSLVAEPTVATGNDGDMTVMVKNNKTLVTIDKRSDLRNGNKTKTKDQKDLTGEVLNGAELEIYEGVGHDGTPIQTLSGDVNTWTLTGELSENTIYTLHEKEAPVGYLEAEDIYFCLFGTRGSGDNLESQLYVWTGTTAPTGTTVTPAGLSASNSSWKQDRNLDNNDLTMVDEAIIAPVDARKVLKSDDANATYTALSGATFDVHISGGDKLGTVVSGSNGYLTWQSLESAALNGLVYNNAGKRIQAASDATGQTVILQQNVQGYTFTETYAPDNAYNEGIGMDKVYHVAISDDNYRQYKANPTWAIDLVAAENDVDHMVDLAAKRANASASDLVNPAYHSTVTLHKYDSDPEGNTASIAGAEFTLYRVSGTTQTVYTQASMGGSVHQNGVFTTSANGNLSITIPEKGTYTLTETKAAAGYKLDSTNTFTFTLVDKDQTATQDNARKFDYNNTTALEKDTTGVPNARQYGVITLTKTDADSSVKLDGVVYTLTRTDKPTVITQYFSVAEQTVITGKSYTASYSGEGAERKCTLTEEAGESGIITISGLDWGTYTLAEKTEVSGYQLDMTNQTQQTAHTKTFTIESSTTSRNEVLYPGAQSDTNTKNSVTFHKTDNGTTPKNLSGAVFEVFRADDTNNETPVSFYLSANSTTPVTQATSSANGTVTVYGLPTDPNSDNPTSYKLVEVTAPKGYVLNPTPVEFTIDRKGVVRMNSSTVTEVPMADKPILVTLKKLGETCDTTLNGAVFTLTPQSGSSFVNNTTTSKTLTLQNGELLIPIETLIGGNSYTLTETKAPDGYEATAVINFTVGTDGRVTIDSTTGGYMGTGTTCSEANNVTWDTGDSDTGAVGEYKSTLSIRDEKIRVTLTKVDSADANTKLQGMEYKLTPCDGSQFTPGYTTTGLSNNVYTATTNASGEITIPEGLLVHGCDYLLQEASIPASLRYYLGLEAQDGVILKVDKAGRITVERLSAHQGKKVGDVDSCPVTVDNTSGHVQLTAKNPKAATFTFTKDVSGNMGDLTGIFKITMNVYEPDGTKIGTKEVTLRKDEKYSSEHGKLNANGTVADSSCAFGPNAIPVGAKLEIKEDPDGDYKAVVAESIDGATVLDEELKGEVWLRLDRDAVTGNITFTLTNNKDVAIDVGVTLERNAPYALMALLIPAAWLYLRARRRRRDGDNG